jgi:glutamyl-tRNA synthetase
MQQLPLKQKVAAMLRYLQQAGLVPTPAPCEVGPKLTRIVEAAGDRLKVFGDILAYADFFFRPHVVYDEPAFDKQVRKPGAAELLAQFRQRLAALDDFSVPSLEAALMAFVSERGIKIGDIIHALRVATTGKAVGPGVYDCLAILGKPAVLERIDAALERTQPAGS